MTTTKTTEEDVLRVSGGTPPEQLAGAIAAAVNSGNPPTLRAIGAAAISQAVKGLIISNQYAASRGLSLSFKPGFADVEIQGKEVTAVTLRVTIDA